MCQYELDGDGEEDLDWDPVTLGVGVTDGVTLEEGEGDGVGDGEGQFCCSVMLSSPTGPSSMEPRFALRATQATTGSQLCTLLHASRQYNTW